MYQDNFLEELQAKYDIRKKDREVLIKEEEVKAKYSRFVLYIIILMKYRYSPTNAISTNAVSR